MRVSFQPQASICYSPCMRLENLGLIRYCQFSALVARAGEVVWCCLPRFDSEPVLSTLLDEQNGGRFTVGAFILYSFWLVEALAAVGRIGEAREVMNNVRSASSPLACFRRTAKPRHARAVRRCGTVTWTCDAFVLNQPRMCGNFLKPIRTSASSTPPSHAARQQNISELAGINGCQPPVT